MLPKMMLSVVSTIALPNDLFLHSCAAQPLNFKCIYLSSDFLCKWVVKPVSRRHRRLSRQTHLQQFMCSLSSRSWLFHNKAFFPSAVVSWRGWKQPTWHRCKKKQEENFFLLGLIDCVDSSSVLAPVWICTVTQRALRGPFLFIGFCLRAYLAASSFFPLLLAPVIAAVIMRVFTNHCGEENVLKRKNGLFLVTGVCFFVVFFFSKNLVKCVVMIYTGGV